MKATRLFLCLGLFSFSLHGQTRVRDFLVQAMPITAVKGAIEETVFSKDQPIHLGEIPGMPPGLAACLTSKQALIVHFAKWNTEDAAKGPHHLQSSHWYAYHATGGQNCELKKASTKADGTLRLYGDKQAILIGINVFTLGKFGIGNSTILYRGSATPGTPANIQNLEQIVAAIAGFSPQAPESPDKAPTNVTSLITAGVVNPETEGLSRFPVVFTIAYTLAPPKPPNSNTNPNPGGGDHPAAVDLPTPGGPPAHVVAAPGPPTPLAPQAPPAAPGGGNNAGNNAAASSPSAGSPASTVDCSMVTSDQPCNFSHTFNSDDKEYWDISIAITTPGIHEHKFTSPTAATTTRHTELYAVFDILPFAWKWGKDSYAPRLNVGLPVTGKPFYRPYFGASENLTGRWKAFPIQLNVFAGVIYAKETFSITPPGGQPKLVTGRTLKGVFGLEVPLASIISKIGGGSKTASPSSGTGKGK